MFPALGADPIFLAPDLPWAGYYRDSIPRTIFTIPSFPQTSPFSGTTRQERKCVRTPLLVEEVWISSGPSICSII